MTNWIPSSIVSQKHWVAIRKVGDELYFNLDSHLQEPEIIGDVSEKPFLKKMTSAIGN